MGRYSLEMSKIPRPGISEKENDGVTMTPVTQISKNSVGPERKALAENTGNADQVDLGVKRKLADVRPTDQTGDDHKSAKMLRVMTCDIPEDELSFWEKEQHETGWSETEFLQHKLSFPKKGDAAKKVATLGQHVKRLRALGWHLYDGRSRALLECERVTEEVERVGCDLAEARGALAKVTDELNAEMKASRATISERTEEINEMKKKIEHIDEKLKEALEEKNALEDEVESYHMNTAGLEQKLQAAETAHAESQKYMMNLQEYNSKLQKEIQAINEQMEQMRQEKARLVEDKASLTGRVQALGDALEALQASSTSTEEARKNAVEELARLRAELASLTAQNSSLSAELTCAKNTCSEQRSDLERYRAATGKDVAALEAEKANSQMLSMRTKAQAETVSALQDQLTMMREQRGAAEAQCDALSEENRSLKAKIAELQVLLPEMEHRLRDSESIRRRLHNTVLELKGNVRVFCRIRPLSENEEQGCESLALAPITTGDLSGRGLELENASQKSALNKDVQKHMFTFDRTFGPSSTQEEVFEEVSMLVQSALDGYRVCIFAYGQTGSGKTHTMLGNPSNEGIIPRSVRQIFSTAEKDSERGWKYTMKAAMLEIYNEDIKDLLGPGPPDGKKHVISSNDTGEAAGVEVSYLEWSEVKSSEDVSRLLKKAMKERSVGSTACNAQSSRSHMVFMLAVDGTNAATGQRLSGALSLVDLAGSERVGKSEVTGDRLKETQSINKSLSALGDVIAALGTKEGHVPYRNSKLTFLLQNSLSGQGKALMLCNVGPSTSAASESLCTLRFASKVNATNIGTARKYIQ